MHTSLEKIHELIDTPRLLSAIDVLSREVETPGLWHLADDLKNIRLAYENMVRFMLAGTEDPGRSTYIQQLQRRLHSIADMVHRAWQTNAQNAEMYYSMVRQYSSVANDEDLCAEALLSASDTAEHEQAVIRMFNRIWSLFPFEKGVAQRLREVAVGDDTPEDVSSQIISAIALSCIKYYEPERLETLLDIYDASEDVSIRARALVATVLVMTSARRRVAADRVLKARLEAWIDDEENFANLKIVVVQMLKTADTDRLNKTLQNDVLPKFKNIRPELLRRFADPEKLSEAGLEDNPEWEELLNESGLQDKLRELTEMQMEGADVMMLPMANLKGYPFFHEAANWFLPFSPNHSTLRDDLDENPAFRLIMSAPGMMCDNDKYSLALSLRHLPEAQREMMRTQLEGSEEMLRQSIDERSLIAAQGRQMMEDEVSRYLRNIYRFVRLYRHKSQFIRLFDTGFTPDMLPFWRKKLLSDSQSVHLFAEFYLRHKNYTSALRMLRAADKAGLALPADYEKGGLCLQRLGRYEEAMAEYEKATLFNAESLWLVKKRAAVCVHLERWAQAAELYDKALEMSPESVSLLMRRADVALQLDDYGRALQLYHKVNWLEPDNEDALRAIAWTEFLAGNYEKSDTWHTKILSKACQPSDLINAAHVQLVNGKCAKAVEMYRRAAVEGADVTEVLVQDREILLSRGVDNEVFEIIVDLLAQKND